MLRFSVFAALCCPVPYISMQELKGPSSYLFSLTLSYDRMASQPHDSTYN